MPSDGLQTLTATALLVFVLMQGQNLIRFAKAKDWNGSVGILLAAVLGIAVAFWAANSNVTDSMILVRGAGALGKMDTGSLCLLGVSLGAAGSTLVDFRKAFDNNSAADKPPIVGQ